MTIRAYFKIFSFQLIQLTFFLHHILAAYFSDDIYLQKIWSLYLIPQVILLIKNKSSRGISLLFFVLYQKMLIDLISDRTLMLNRRKHNIVFALLPGVMPLILNTLILLLIIIYHKRRFFLFIELLLSFAIITLSAYYPDQIKYEFQLLQAIVTIFWAVLLTVDGSQNICFSIFAPKVLTKLRKPTFTYGVGGFLTILILSIGMYKSIKRGKGCRLRINKEQIDQIDDTGLEKDKAE